MLREGVYIPSGPKAYTKILKVSKIMTFGVTKIIMPCIEGDMSDRQLSTTTTAYHYFQPLTSGNTICLKLIISSITLNRGHHFYITTPQVEYRLWGINSSAVTFYFHLVHSNCFKTFSTDRPWFSPDVNILFETLDAGR